MVLIITPCNESNKTFSLFLETDKQSNYKLTLECCISSGLEDIWEHHNSYYANVSTPFRISIIMIMQDREV
jgi:hypothetical protein